MHTKTVDFHMHQGVLSIPFCPGFDTLKKLRLILVQN